jgi:hypothetical protein
LNSGAQAHSLHECGFQKKENFRKRACFSFAFLTANPGKP